MHLLLRFLFSLSIFTFRIWAMEQEPPIYDMGSEQVEQKKIYDLFNKQWAWKHYNPNENIENKPRASISHLKQLVVEKMLENFPQHFDGPNIKKLPEELQYFIAQNLLRKFQQILFPLTICKNTFYTHKDYIASLHFNPHGADDLTIADDSGLEFWKGPKSVSKANIPHILHAKFNSDGRFLIISSIQGQQLVVSIHDKMDEDNVNIMNVGAMSFHNGGNKIAAIIDGKPSIITVTTSHIEPFQHVPSSFFYPTIRLSPDESKFLVRYSKESTPGTLKKQFYVCDVNTQNVLFSKELPDNTEVYFTKDGKKIFTFIAIGFHLWHAGTGALATSFTDWEVIEDTPLNKNAISRDGSTFLRIKNHHMELWNSYAGKRIQKFIGHTKDICSNNFNDDETKIITAAADKTVRIWDKETGHCLCILRDIPETIEEDLVAKFINDTASIVTYSHENTDVRVWDVSFLQQVPSLEQTLLLALLYAKHKPGMPTLLDSLDQPELTQLDEQQPNANLRSLLKSFNKELREAIVNRYLIVK